MILFINIFCFFRNHRQFKLPNIISRKSLLKNTRSSIGSIQFYTDREENICGLDEAMQNIGTITKEIDVNKCFNTTALF